MKLETLFLRYLLTHETFYNRNPDFIKNFEIKNTDFQFKYSDSQLSYNLVYSLANLSANAYFEQGDKNWIDPNTNQTTDVRFSNDTVHAYLFSNEDNTVNILSFKGTSLGITGGISKNDKLNDNLFYSCCYYEQSSLFDKRECGCINNPESCIEKQNNYKYKSLSKKYQNCYKKCYLNSTLYDINYLNIADKIIQNVFILIGNNSNLILTGHSLGGTLAAMMGIKYKYLTVTFQSPGEKYYLDMINYYDPDNIYPHIYHFGHNADIIFTGKCNGIFSWCYIAGYIVETKCHIGKICEYDAIGKLGISESITTHPLRYVIDNIITKWIDENGKNILPNCIYKNNCTDCNKWNIIN